jgi:hypothetical protein
MRCIALIVLILGLAGCGTAPDDAVAALFEHRDFPQKRYCLAVQNADPAPALLARIHTHNPKVLPASKCRRGNVGYRTADGAEASFVIITDIRRKSPSVIMIEVARDSGFMFGSSSTRYKVEKLSGQWVVTDSVLDAIS